jgi:hypothetical protein
MLTVACDAVAPSPTDVNVTAEPATESAVPSWEPAPDCGAFPDELLSSPANRVQLGQDTIQTMIGDLGEPYDRGEMDNDEKTPFASWIIVDEPGTSFFSVTEDGTGFVNSIYIDFPVGDDGITSLPDTCTWWRPPA